MKDSHKADGLSIGVVIAQLASMATGSRSAVVIESEVTNTLSSSVRPIRAGSRWDALVACLNELEIGMTEHRAKKGARRRLFWALPGISIYLVFALTESLGTPWICAGLGMALSAVLAEPHYFRDPKAGMINSAAALFLLLDVSKVGVEPLWWSAFAVVASVLVVSTYLVIGKAHWFDPGLERYVSTIGQARVVGPVVLCVIFVSLVAREDAPLAGMAITAAILMLSISKPWPFWEIKEVRSERTGTVLSVIGPKFILVSETSDLTIATGSNVLITIPDRQPISGAIASCLPSPEGMRYAIGIDEEWSSLGEVTLPQDMDLILDSGGDKTVGFVGEGSSDRQLEFSALKELFVGDSVRVETSTGDHLYQVTDLSIANTNWGTANALTVRGRALVVGRPTSAGIDFASGIPKPHQRIETFGSDPLVSVDKSSTCNIGLIKGTNIPISLDLNVANHAHVAVLGMTGTGKSHLATRICRALGLADHVVLALDPTGEYRGHFGVEPWPNGNFGSTGFFAEDVLGNSTAQAKERLDLAIAEGTTEFSLDQTPTRRWVVLEEAHSFIPEGTRADVKEVGANVMKARKYGVSTMVVSQRTASVSKATLSQCSSFVIFRSVDAGGSDFMSPIIGRDLARVLPSLGPYEAVCVGPLFNSLEPVVVSVDEFSFSRL